MNKNSTNALEQPNSGAQDVGAKKSCLSPTLLSNYVLAITLLKNIAMKHAYPDTFEQNFEQYMTYIKQIEQILFSMGSIEQPSQGATASEGGEDDFDNLNSGVAVSFLIK